MSYTMLMNLTRCAFCKMNFHIGDIKYNLSLFVICGLLLYRIVLHFTELYYIVFYTMKYDTNGFGFIFYASECIIIYCTGFCCIE